MYKPANNLTKPVLATCLLLLLSMSAFACSRNAVESKEDNAHDPGITRNKKVQQNTRFENLKLKGGRNLKYAIHLPEGFDKSKAYPTIIGPGSGTKEDSPSFYWHGNPSEHGWIIVESMAHLEGDPVNTTKQLLDQLTKMYRIEGNKFHMVGFSANSAGSFKVGIDLADRFHSLVGVAGYPRSNPDSATVKKLKDVKFFFIVGDQDKYWMDQSKRSHEYLKAKGLDSQLEIIKDGQHVLKKIDGRPFMKLMERMR